MPTLRSTSFGDMIITLMVEIPKNLSENQKRLLKEFNEESTQNNNPESSGFFPDSQLANAITKAASSTFDKKTIILF